MASSEPASMARMVAQEVEQKQPITRNNFKCPKCHRVRTRVFW